MDNTANSEVAVTETVIVEEPLNTQYLIEKGWEYTENIVGALGILIIGYLSASILCGAVKKKLDNRPNLDAQVRTLIVRILRLLILSVTIVAVLGNFGIETASIIAVLGGLGLAVGLALQGSLSNVASGVMIMLIRPFTIGNVIKTGGEVFIIDDIGLIATKAHLPDGPQVTIPNNRLWGGEIVNLSVMHEDLRRIDQIFGISYNDDIPAAYKVIQAVLAADERFMTDPEPLLAVESLGDSSVNVLCRVWVKPEDWFAAKLDLIERVKVALEDQGLSIPYPQRDVHITQQ